jgi:hypothetical protein
VENDAGILDAQRAKADGLLIPSCFSARAKSDPWRRAQCVSASKTQWTSRDEPLNSRDLNMKNNGISTILNWVLIAGAVALLISGIKFYNKSKTVRNYTGLITEFSKLQNAQAVFTGLTNETMEYSKTHPAINPTLEKIGVPKAGATPAKPAAR